jgi:hypothetical protein
LFNEDFIKSNPKLTNAFEELKKLDYVKTKRILDSLNTKPEGKDMAMLNMLNGYVNYEVGNIKESAACSSVANTYLEANNTSILDPVVISNKMDSLYSSIRISKQVSNAKTQGVEELAKAKLINDPNLIAKGYSMLGYIYLCSYMPSLAKYYNTKALEVYQRSKLKNEHLLNRIVSSPSLLDYKALTNFLKSYGRDNKPGIINNIKYNGINTRNPYESNKLLDSIISSMKDTDTKDYLLIKSLVSKYIVYEANDRQGVSECYLEEALNVLDNHYPKDSHNYIDFYCRVLLYNSNYRVEKQKLDKVIVAFNDFLNRNGLTYPNVNSIAYLYNRVIVSLLYNEGINDLTKKYGEFYNTHRQLIGDESEYLFDLNFMLWMKGYSNIYTSFINRNK